MRNRILLIGGLALALAVSPWSARTGYAEALQEVEFRDATVQDAIRVIAEQAGVNIVATAEAGKRRFSLFLRALSVRDAIDSIARVAGLWYRVNPKTGVYVVMTTDEYFEDIIVFREEATEVFTLRYQNVLKVARTIEAMFGSDRVRLNGQQDSDDELAVPGATLGTGTSSSGTSSSGGRQTRQTRQNRQSGGSSGSAGGASGVDAKQELRGLTTEQIQLLEKVERRAGEDPLLLSESALAGVRKQSSQLPIFLAVNREHNQLFARTADEKAMAEIRRLVSESDRPTPQVLLEMKVLSVSLEDGFRSAFDFSYGSGDTTGVPDGQPPNPLAPTAATTPEQLLGLVNAPLIGSSTFVFQIMSSKIRARLEVLQTQGRVDILATPMLLAANNRPAKIFIGEQTVVTTGFTSGETGSTGGVGNTFVTTPIPTTETVEVGNTLTILPSINADRTVLMRLLQEASRVQPNGATIPVVTGGAVTQVSIDTVDKSTMEGTAMAKDGLTVVVGGMVTETTSDTERKIPLLGDIPLVGNLFKDVDKSSAKEELILLITPHVFTTPEEAEAISRQRFGELAQSPNQVDVYLNKLDSTRAKTPIGRIKNRGVEQASPVPMSTSRSSLEGTYIALTRFAAERMRGWRLLQPENARVQNVLLQFNRPFSLVLDEALETRPKRSWREGPLYVTAVEAYNRGALAKTLDVPRFAGQWLAASAQATTLAPGERTLVFLISDRPFEQAATPSRGG